MPRTRPSSIQELANEAVQNNWDPSKDLKFYLKQAEKFRKVGKEYADSGDIESAFIEYARAATLVLEKLPQHKDYHTMLSKQQRQNLSLNGQDILDSLGELKPVLVQRHEQWTTRHPNDTTTPTARSVKAQQPSPEDDDRRRKMAEEVYRMKQQREGGYNMPYPPPSHAPSHPPSGMPAPSAPPDPRANAALAAARQAAGSSSSASQAARHRQQPPSSHPALDPRQAEAARAVQQRLSGGNGIVTSTSSTPIYQMPTASPAPAMYPSRHPSTRTAPYQTFQQARRHQSPNASRTPRLRRLWRLD
ncbi:hypothetical protein DL96DRAFT_1232990 [Flagelloscypha sp. PMI_526]|nr:hypothetical protein DL96DRAFT_1232990 [Flagelloscypha sp. PMI_526]